MLEWFIDLAYALEGTFELYILLVFVIFWFIWICADNYEKKLELEEKAENYEKVQDFIQYLFYNKPALRMEVSRYLRRKKMIENREERQKEIDDFMSIL